MDFIYYIYCLKECLDTIYRCYHRTPIVYIIQVIKKLVEALNWASRELF